MHYLVRQCPIGGLSSSLVCTLSQLWAIETRYPDLTPFFGWTHPCHHSEPSLGVNVWNYYFEQSSEEIHMVRDGQEDINHLSHSLAAEDVDIMEQVREAANKFIKPAKHLADLVDTFAKKFAGHKVLGVHYRDTDMPILHGVKIDIDDACKKIAQVKKLTESTLIFIATECQKSLDHFRKWGIENNHEIVHTECWRIENTEILDTKFFSHLYQGSDRPLHRYLLGLEVLTDIYLMGKCDSFLHGYSGVSNTAIYLGKTPKENIFDFRKLNPIRVL